MGTGRLLRSLTSWFVFFRGIAIVILVAWIVSLPMVLLVEKTDGWRLGLLAVSGALMGPALLTILDLRIRASDPRTENL